MDGVIEFKICNKLTFDSRKGAKAFTRRIGRSHQQRAYKCPYCGWFHNTSISSGDRKDIKEFINKGDQDE
ncbi:hypothetical protein JLT2_53 [Paraglaciecola Antarctic JLT virus 2]|nr:hypothetical protein JLT2_53 [Paraglaciecola Antarctic JLT virus 2]